MQWIFTKSILYRLINYSLIIQQKKDLPFGKSFFNLYLKSYFTLFTISANVAGLCKAKSANTFLFNNILAFNNLLMNSSIHVV